MPAGLFLLVNAILRLSLCEVELERAQRSSYWPVQLLFCTQIQPANIVSPLRAILCAHLLKTEFKFPSRVFLGSSEPTHIPDQESTVFPPTLDLWKLFSVPFQNAS